MGRQGRLLRDMKESYNCHLKTGMVVYEYHGCTYGAISPGGVAVSLAPNVPPFLEVPLNSVHWDGEPAPKYSEGPMRLENWRWFGTHMFGEVYGHPQFPDGTPIHTSTVRESYQDRVVTRNSVYLLGRPALVDAL